MDPKTKDLIARTLVRAAALIEAVDAPAYQGEHGAPHKGAGAPLHDLTLEGTYPADVYSVNGLRYYGTGDNLDSAAYSIIMGAHDRPNKKIRIYRAYPKSAPVGINPRDWVTTVRSYAVGHCKASIKEPCRISTKLVYARDLFTNGDSWLEYGYDPQPAAPLTQEEKDRKAMKVRTTRQDRLDRVRRGERLVMVNKYPSDKWYGKEEDFLKTDGSL